MNPFVDKDILSLNWFRRSDFDLVFSTAMEMEPVVWNRTRIKLLEDKVLGVCFFQPSTRTRVSFESAMQRLGGAVVGFSDPKVTRAGDYYEESLEDVSRMMESYSDALVIRHPKDFGPAAAADVVDIPVINAGDGYNEHPTQSLLDGYTILRKKGRLDGLNIALVGDMNMRVMHALPLMLAEFGCKVFFISPKDQSLPVAWVEEYRKRGLDFQEMGEIDEKLAELDAIYLMGTLTPSYGQGRVEASKEKPRTPRPYVIDREKLEKARPDVILLHPLPRTDELPKDVDALPAAHYFIQARYGVVVRMALLALIFDRAS
jgi:aspartate carbamoyltransferase catalytic subunit